MLHLPIFMKQPKMTIGQKLAWLRRNAIITRAETPRESTVNRLYSFYQRNPLDTPRNLAYGMPKRVDRTLQRKGTLQTPKGAVPAKQYVKKIDVDTGKAVMRDVSPDVYRVSLSKHFKSVGKVRDTLFIRIMPPVVSTSQTFPEDVEERIDEVVYFIEQEITKLWNRRKRFYSDNHRVGALLFYTTANVKTQDNREERSVTITNPDGWMPMPWCELSQVRSELKNSFMVVCSMVMRYESSAVFVNSVEIFISNKDKETRTVYDTLR